jgi:hypothetical protein
MMKTVSIRVVTDTDGFTRVLAVDDEGVEHLVRNVVHLEIAQDDNQDRARVKLTIVGPELDVRARRDLVTIKERMS